MFNPTQPTDLIDYGASIAQGAIGLDELVLNCPDPWHIAYTSGVTGEI